MDKQSEYLVLNNRILALEKNAFERTALIGFIGFPCLGIVDNGFYYWVPFLIMLLLVFNVNYTITNLKKAIQLKVYIQTVLEGNKTYMSLSNFLYHQDSYKKTYKEEIKKIRKEFDDSEDITIDKNPIERIKTMTIAFLILYLVITIIFINSDSSYRFWQGEDQLSAMPLSGGILGILTFTIGLFTIPFFTGGNTVVEKVIAEKVLEEVRRTV
jgi:hypothetical protein